MDDIKTNGMFQSLSCLAEVLLDILFFKGAIAPEENGGKKMLITTRTDTSRTTNTNSVFFWSFMDIAEYVPSIG